jgi:hypothetical protein
VSTITNVGLAPWLFNLYIDPKEAYPVGHRLNAFLAPMAAEFKAHAATFKKYPPKDIGLGQWHGHTALSKYPLDLLELTERQRLWEAPRYGIPQGLSGSSLRKVIWEPGRGPAPAVTEVAARVPID